MLRHALRCTYIQRTRPCNLLRGLDFNSPRIVRRRLRLPPIRNTEAAAVAQAAEGTVVAGQEAVALAVELEAVPVAEPVVAQAGARAARAVAPEALEAVRAGPAVARQSAAPTATRLTIRRGKSFRNFLRRHPRISR